MFGLATISRSSNTVVEVERGACESLPDLEGLFMPLDDGEGESVWISVGPLAVAGKCDARQGGEGCFS